MDRTGTNDLEPKCAGTEEDAFLFLDVEEQDKPPLDWHHRESLANREGENIFFRLLLFFFFAFLFSICVGDGSGGILDFGPALPVPVPPHTGTVVFLVFLIALVVGGRRKSGALVARMGVHDRLFELVPVDGKTAVCIPTDKVKTIEFGTGALGVKKCRMTLVDTDGRRYTIKDLADTSRLAAFDEFCQRAHIGYEHRKEWSVKKALLYGTILALLCVLVAAEQHKHPIPTAIALFSLVFFYYAAFLGLYKYME